MFRNDVLIVFSGKTNVLDVVGRRNKKNNGGGGRKGSKSQHQQKMAAIKKTEIKAN